MQNHPLLLSRKSESDDKYKSIHVKDMTLASMVDPSPSENHKLHVINGF